MPYISAPAATTPTAPLPGKNDNPRCVQSAPYLVSRAYKNGELCWQGKRNQSIEMCSTCLADHGQVERLSPSSTRCHCPADGSNNVANRERAQQPTLLISTTSQPMNLHLTESLVDSVSRCLSRHVHSTNGIREADTLPRISVRSVSSSPTTAAFDAPVATAPQLDVSYGTDVCTACAHRRATPVARPTTSPDAARDRYSSTQK